LSALSPVKVRPGIRSPDEFGEVGGSGLVFLDVYSGQAVEDNPPVVDDLVGVDAVGVLPLFMHLTEGVDRHAVRKVIVQSMVTALVVSLAFLAVGKWIFEYLGITVADFLIAGGILLFTISLIDIITVEKTVSQIDADSMGAVPIGVPLIVGPAVLTTSRRCARERISALARLKLMTPTTNCVFRDFSEMTG